VCFFENVFSRKGWQKKPHRLEKIPNVWVLPIAQGFHPFLIQFDATNTIDAFKHFADFEWFFYNTKQK